MINAENIGNRIRFLRKQKGLSQEELAEELGMYQADVSNLERAANGSGISDLYKLDMIADYFGISLIDLIKSDNDDVPAPISENHTNNIEIDWGQCYVDEVRYYYDSTNEYPVEASEIKLTSSDGTIVFFSFSEYNYKPCIYKSPKSSFNMIISSHGLQRFKNKLQLYCIVKGDDYVDVYSRIAPEYLKICRCLIYVAKEEKRIVDGFINKATGRKLDEIDCPKPGCEPEKLFDIDFSNLAIVYKSRLMVETALKHPSVFDDIDSLTIKQEKVLLEKLKDACESETAYKVWKKDLIDEKIRMVTEKQHIVVCKYMFFGMGQYEEIMPDTEVDSFKMFIDANGSAVLLSIRDATRPEIRAYVSLHIADELLGIKSPLP